MWAVGWAIYCPPAMLVIMVGNQLPTLRLDICYVATSHCCFILFFRLPIGVDKAA